MVSALEKLYRLLNLHIVFKIILICLFLCKDSMTSMQGPLKHFTGLDFIGLICMDTHSPIDHILIH